MPNPVPQSIASQLADALLAVAVANHYMVGITYAYTLDDLDNAEQELITLDNADSTDHTRLALDWVENARRMMLDRERRTLIGGGR